MRGIVLGLAALVSAFLVTGCGDQEPEATELVYRVEPDPTSPGKRDLKKLAAGVHLRARYAGFHDIVVYYAEETRLTVKVRSRDEKKLLLLKGAIANSGDVELRLVANEHSQVAMDWLATGVVPEGYTVCAVAGTGGKGVPPQKVLVSDDCEMTGESVAEAYVDTSEESMEIDIHLAFTSEGSRRFSDITKRNVGRRLAIIIDTQRDVKGNIIGKDEAVGAKPADGPGYAAPLTPGRGTCISTPVIEKPIDDGEVTLSGIFALSGLSVAHSLATILAGGRPTARLVLEEERRTRWRVR